jgi:thymidylate synthase (FAD)
MKVDYVDHMGSDLTVVNAARVSFDKHKDKFDESDEKLIKYLASNGHWTPFSHPVITVRVTVPIFVARQLFKHKVGMTENEVSRRYVDDTPEFFYPEVWRGRPTNGAKQGSSEDVVKSILFKGTAESWESEIDNLYSLHITQCENLYNSMIEGGVAPEQARMVLPQSMYTSWYWTGSLASFARIYKQRTDSHAQKETQEVATMLDEIIRPLFPVSWKELTLEVSK